MRYSTFALQILLCMSLFVPAVRAQEITVPDKAHRQGMSYEEYTKFRERMRQQMEKTHSKAHKLSRDTEDSTQEQMEMHRHNSAYGQGYQSRISEDRPDNIRESRPERPERPEHIERVDRGDMGRR